MTIQRLALLLTVGTISLASLMSSGCGGGGNITTLQGAGATFPAPLYQRWFSEYHKLHPEVEINYQRIGSGAGIQQVHRRPGELRGQRRGHEGRGHGQGRGRRPAAAHDGRQHRPGLQPGGPAGES